MAMYTSNFSYLLDPGIRTIWGDTYPTLPKYYTQIFDVVKSTKNAEESLELAGLGLVPTKAQGQGVTYQDAYQGYYKQWTNVTYGLGFIITREMWEDDQYRKMQALPKALSRSMNHTIETVCANILNNAFTSGTGGDGSYLCVTSHALVGGGTEQNTLTTAADLSMTALEQALIDIGDITDAAGLMAGLKAKKLIVPPELDWTAAQMLQSTLFPEDNFNAINPAKGRMPYIVNPFLTDSDAWFIQTDAPTGLVLYMRREPDFTKDNDFDSENGKWKVTARFVPGWDDWRGVYGVAGA